MCWMRRWPPGSTIRPGKGVRRVVENLFVTKDWFEVFVAQNLVLDGLVYPLILRRYVTGIGERTGNALPLVTEFHADWFDETARWVDATVKTAAEASPANAERLSSWYREWRDEGLQALQPLAELALHDSTVLPELQAELDTRARRLGLAIT